MVLGFQGFSGFLRAAIMVARDLKRGSELWAQVLYVDCRAVL